MPVEFIENNEPESSFKQGCFRRTAFRIRIPFRIEAAERIFRTLRSDKCGSLAGIGCPPWVLSAQIQQVDRYTPWNHGSGWQGRFQEDLLDPFGLPNWTGGVH